MRTPQARAQPVCFPSLDIATALAETAGESFLFSATSRAGALLYFFGSKKTFTVFVQNPDGTVCTGDALLGEVLDYDEQTCA